jgi:FtsP/CotA-like multicopper oxidase with cupredoxin domain
VSDFSLLLGPAERADAIVDFSNYAGQTFILYNDAPAAFPALDPRNDYYTGNPDQTDTGGTVSTLPGKGPNTRTLMQIHVEGAGSGITFDSAALQAAFTSDLAATPAKIGVFRASQDPIIVGQSDTLYGVPAYEAAYGTTFPRTAPYWGLGSIFNSNVSFQTVDGQQVTLLAQPKAIHDEMGATFDDYGRMKASLGVQMPNPTPNLANFIMQGYADPATEVVKLVTTPIGNPTADGTQIWRVNHNGVDTHPIHFHLFHVQVVNRVGWDGAYRLPHPTELGWKDTVRISPLEDTYVALRPIAPRPDSLPSQVPNSFRPLDPTLPIGSRLGFSNIDPLGNPIVPGITNQVANFGWEYVWHCHILAHEENDMMRAVVFATPPEAPTGLTATVNVNDVVLSWTDPSVVANGFSLQRATDAAFTTGLVTTPLGLVTTFTDRPTTGTYFYRVFASNTVGSGVPNYPTITANSEQPSNTASVVFTPAQTVVVQPTALVFGDQLVGTNSAVRTVALTNNGTATVTINSVTFSVADFSRNGGTCTGTLLVGRTCTINVRFRPTATGPRAGQLVITTSAAGTPPTVALSGNGIAPFASAAPAALTFSTPLSIPSTSQVVTVTNTGTAPLTVTNVTRTGPNANQFTHVNGCAGTWPVGGSCTISVTFSPTAASPITKNAVLNVVVAAPAANATVALTGNIVVPTFTVTPRPVDFGNWSVSGGATQIAVTVANTGAAPLRITGINRTGGATTQFPQVVNPPLALGGCPISPATLAAGATCTVNALFDPTSAGLKTTNLNVNVGAPAASQSVPMSGTGILP